MWSELTISPLRSIEDFLLSKARFEKPRLKSGQRVVSNLLYYQTNYFIITMLICAIFSLMSPQNMLLSVIILGTGGLAYMFSSKIFMRNMRGQVEQRSKYQTYLSIAIIIATMYLMLYNISSIMTLLTSLLLSVILILIHASMRLRNLKNKITKITSVMATKKTPMTIILNAFNVSSEDFLN